MTEPTPAEGEEFRRRLHAVIARGLKRVAAREGAETAVAMAQQFDAGNYRVATEVDLDDDQKPVPGSLMFRIDIWVPSADEFVWFAIAKASALGVSPEMEASEAAMTLLQHGIGVPDDLSELDDP
jgi:hypothetical protein